MAKIRRAAGEGAREACYAPAAWPRSPQVLQTHAREAQKSRNAPRPRTRMMQETSAHAGGSRTSNSAHRWNRRNSCPASNPDPLAACRAPPVRSLGDLPGASPGIARWRSSSCPGRRPVQLLMASTSAKARTGTLRQRNAAQAGGRAVSCELRAFELPWTSAMADSLPEWYSFALHPAGAAARKRCSANAAPAFATFLASAAS